MDKLQDLERIFNKHYHDGKDLTIETIIKESYYIKTENDFIEAWEDYKYKHYPDQLEY